MPVHASPPPLLPLFSPLPCSSIPVHIRPPAGLPRRKCRVGKQGRKGMGKGREGGAGATRTAGVTGEVGEVGAAQATGAREKAMEINKSRVGEGEEQDRRRVRTGGRARSEREGTSGRRGQRVKSTKAVGKGIPVGEAKKMFTFYNSNLHDCSICLKHAKILRRIRHFMD